MKLPQAVRDFITFTQTQEGQPWHLSGSFTAGIGWRVRWTCAGRVLEVSPSDARKLARYLRSQFLRTFGATPAKHRQLDKEVEIFAWVDRLDAYGKETLANNRAGVRPAQQAPSRLPIGTP